MRILPFAVLAILATPGVGYGATASVVSDSADLNDIVLYQAVPGEANQVVASVPAFRMVTIHDSGATITAGAGCLSVDPHEVSCAVSDERCCGRNIVQLGDLDDTLTLANGFIHGSFDVRGGAGEDTLNDDCLSCGRLHGGPGNDTLTGGGLESGGLFGDGGNDTLIGSSPASVELFGGSGNDTLSAGVGRADRLYPGSGDDEVDGGEGAFDLVSYLVPIPAAGPITADLRTGIVTGQGTDTLVGVEQVEGSSHADQLIGNSGPNVLRGAGGMDVLRGLGGSDRLFGGKARDSARGGPGSDILSGFTGTDHLLGGSGDDSLRAKDGLRDFIRGGPGSDLAGVDLLLDVWLGVESVR